MRAKKTEENLYSAGASPEGLQWNRRNITGRRPNKPTVFAIADPRCEAESVREVWQEKVQNLSFVPRRKGPLLSAFTREKWAKMQTPHRGAMRHEYSRIAQETGRTLRGQGNPRQRGHGPGLPGLRQRHPPGSGRQDHP